MGQRSSVATTKNQNTRTRERVIDIKKKVPKLLSPICFLLAIRSSAELVVHHNFRLPNSPFYLLLLILILVLVLRFYLRPHIDMQLSFASHAEREELEVN